jgi:hypothetical protein
MTSKSKPATPQQPSGAPRWTYSLGAVVGAVGLCWAIVSNFIPKPEPVKPALVSAPMSPSGPISVTAPGNDNVVIGQMTGGTITKGARTSESDQKK